MGRNRRLAQRRLEGALPPRPQPRAKRLGLVAGYAAPYEPPRDPGPEQHIDVSRPGELVGVDCFYVGRLRGTKGAIWQLTAIDIASSFARVELVIAKRGNPSAKQTSGLARRVAAELGEAGWKAERFLSDNGNEFKGDFTKTVNRLKARHTRIARYMQPRLSGLRRELDTYLRSIAGGACAPLAEAQVALVRAP